MKNSKLKKFIAMTLIISLELSALTITAAGMQDGGKLVEQRIKELEATMPSAELLKKEDVANSQYQNLLEAIVTDSGYPSYYAGAYLNENKELVVVLTEKSSQVVSTVRQATQNNKVIIEYATYPLNYLKALKYKLIDAYEQLSIARINGELLSINEINLLDDFSGFYIDEVANEIAVEIQNISEEKIRIFKSLFGDDAGIRFEEGGNNECTAAEWRPGSPIFKSNNKRASTGYRCYYIDENGIRYNGFASAGHGFSVGEAVYRRSNSIYQIGVCKASQFRGTSDVAFIAITDSNYEGSNIMMYSDPYGSEDGVAIAEANYVESVLTNTTIYKVGSTSYLTQGHITATDYISIYDWNSIITDLYKTTVYVDGGDSGGCAYIYHDGRYVAAGTVSGKQETNSGEFEFSMISKIKNARDDLGLRKY